MPVVFDHFAGAKAALGSGQPGFDTVLGLVKSGRAYVKVSGAYRASNNAPIMPMSRRLNARWCRRIPTGLSGEQTGRIPMP
jgi:predicted TIM-barrel fold metal-dependent hydrolase